MVAIMRGWIAKRSIPQVLSFDVDLIEAAKARVR